jgi:hypothetical protein
LPQFVGLILTHLIGRAVTSLFLFHVEGLAWEGKLDTETLGQTPGSVRLYCRHC